MRLTRHPSHAPAKPAPRPDFREALADGKRKAASEAREVIAAGVLAAEKRECDAVDIMCDPAAFFKFWGANGKPTVEHT